jgi:predicted aspartyl protease
VSSNLRCFTWKYDGIARVLRNDIFVSEAYDPNSGLPIPKTMSYKGIWDSGATGTAITLKVVDGLNLSPTGKTSVSTANGIATNVNTYLVNIGLPNDFWIIGITATLATLSADTDLLIGMDIISLGDFAVTNNNGKTRMTFRIPSLRNIDFVEEWNQHHPPQKHAGWDRKGIDNARKKGKR